MAIFIQRTTYVRLFSLVHTRRWRRLGSFISAFQANIALFPMKIGI